MVDETRFPTGSVSLTLRDRATGGLVQAFCGDVLTTGFLDPGCTETGTLLLHGLPEGEHQFSMTSAGTGYIVVLGTVIAGRVTEQVVE